jgi:hypothetical protein
MRPLPYVIKRPVKPDYHAAPYSAEPEPDAAQIYPDDEPEARAPYPRSFVERPLVLPDGMAQGSVGTRVGRETFDVPYRDDLRLLYLQGYASGSIGVAGVEIYGGVTLNLAHDDNLRENESFNLPFFQIIDVGAEFEVTSTTALGVQGVLGNADKRRRYSPSVFVSHKLAFSDRNAIYLGGTLDYNHANDIFEDMEVTTERLGAYAGATVRTQPSPVFAMQVSGTVAYFKYVDDYHPREDTFHSLSAGFALMFSVSERTDVSPYLSVSTSDDVDGGAVGLTLTKR